MTCFVRIGFGGQCSQLTNPWKLNPTVSDQVMIDDTWTNVILPDKNALVGKLDDIKKHYGYVLVETQQEAYQLAHVVPHRFFSTAEDRDIAIFQSIGVPMTETNLLRGFKFPFPLSLPIFYGPILAAFIYSETYESQVESKFFGKEECNSVQSAELQIDGMSLEEWSKIVAGWQDMALIRAGTQTETLKPYWTSDTAITEGALTDAEGALDDVSDLDPDQPKNLDDDESSTEDDDGYSTEEEPDELDIDDNEESDELDVLTDNEVDPELLAYCRKTLAEDDEE
jgi:hypothetical protein